MVREHRKQERRAGRSRRRQAELLARLHLVVNILGKDLGEEIGEGSITAEGWCSGLCCWSEFGHQRRKDEPRW